MTLSKMTATAALVVGLATAGWGISVTAGTSPAGAGTTAANASLAASRAVSRTGRPVSSQDRTFMHQASQINLTEIALGRYMRAHGITTTARHLGGLYAHDHTAAQSRLRSLASRLHVTLPASPGAQLGSVVARVEALRGRTRDIAFARDSVSGHLAAIAIFRKEESAGSNSTVKAYATHYLPMLRTHLRLARHAESVLRGATRPG